jgi:2-polyprenyl-3-methyl-5-hydroxy-6-metoxy-1,4-benzoquinol methylase
MQSGLGRREGMTQDQPIAPFDWFANQFTSQRREEFIEKIYPYVKAYLKPGDRVVDLCCGAGPIAIFLEEQGAQVTGIDLAPYLITLARQEAVERGAKADFVQANVLTYPLGEGIYDLAVCFGNAITDFPHPSFPQFRDRVFDALKPGGHFILEYIDGLQRVAFMSEPKEVVEQGWDSQIVRRFKEYDPAMSAYKMKYRRLSTNETCEVTEYVYTGPLIRLLLEVRFEFVQSIRLDYSFMDVYIKRRSD